VGAKLRKASGRAPSADVGSSATLQPLSVAAATAFFVDGKRAIKAGAFAMRLCCGARRRIRRGLSRYG
jgi:hypothetical protein